MSETVVVCGALARRPGRGGHAWQFLQYLLGFRRLGYEPFFLDRLEEDDPAGAAYLAGVMGRFGIDYELLLPGGPRGEALDRLRESTLLLDVMGYLQDEELLAVAPLRVFLDTDPGYWQMWTALGLAAPFGQHDVYVTIGEHVGTAGCSVPTCGLDWVTTRQPVVLDEWSPDGAPADARFTGVGAWRGPYAPVEFEGRTYGQRAHQFRKFVDLPRRSGARFELALEIDPADARDLALLEESGWELVDPAQVAADVDAYREYVRGSLAELMVARGMYVDSGSGWFSERSACYLAAGRPVLAQDTGIRDLYPTGEGLLTFSTLDEAVAGVERIDEDYDRHARAARALADEHFDSDRVLTRLLERVGA